MILPHSLKNRLIILLLFSSLIPLILIGTMSISSMFSILKNKAEKGMTSNLHQVRLSFENTLSQLNFASQQLVFEGRVGNNLDAYLTAQPYDKKTLGDAIASEISLIHFANPALGLIFYYLADTGEVLFQNSHISEDFDVFKQPLLSEQLQLTYYGPHVSLDPLDGNNVLSVVRKVELPVRDDVFLYMETNFKLTDRIMSIDEIFEDTFYFFVDTSGRIAYSENQDVFPVGTLNVGSFSDHNQDNDYYLFEELSNQSWRIVAAVPKNTYNQEINRWVKQFVILTALTLCVVFVLAIIIWRMIYTPLIHLRRNIRHLQNEHLLSIPSFKYNKILEFSEIHEEFSMMKLRIDELIDDINRNAKSQRQLEIENLLYKINPHFIHNTLDTIRWQARANGHYETDRIVSTLNKLLYYNLGKGNSARISDEIEALKNYMIIQGIRYNIKFDVQINADPAVLDLSIPRFILQPLVENSLYHGLQNKEEDRGKIEVVVLESTQSQIQIKVKDNGFGMTEVEVARMMSGEVGMDNKTGMGIGWQYVRRMLDLQFAGKAKMSVVSDIGIGTTITLHLPIASKEEGNDVERNDR